ncbi:MAG: PQQ-binding-like beta-propeller repeat protein [Verrucomicrobiales bacterium]
MEQIGSAEFTSPIYSTPTVANGVLYVQTQTHLYAFEKK